MSDKRTRHWDSLGEWAFKRPLYMDLETDGFLHAIVADLERMFPQAINPFGRAINYVSGWGFHAYQKETIRFCLVEAKWDDRGFITLGGIITKALPFGPAKTNKRTGLPTRRQRYQQIHSFVIANDHPYVNGIDPAKIGEITTTVV